MSLQELVLRVSNFHQISNLEKVRLFAWHLHTHQNMETFETGDIRKCFNELHAVVPNISLYLLRMREKKPPEVFFSRQGYKLEGSIRQALNAKYGEHPSVIAVRNLLAGLPARVPDLAEKAFLTEALDCYRVNAFRAAIVMTWNLAFNHLLNWILNESKRLMDFNAAIAKVYPKKSISISKLIDFEEFKEAEVIEVCRAANLFSKNTVEILREKLKRRNIAAHPSGVVVTQPQADDVITDLVNNIILVLN